MDAERQRFRNISLDDQNILFRFCFRVCLLAEHIRIVFRLLFLL